MHDIDRTQLGLEYGMDGEQPYESEDEQATLAAELMELETEEEFESFLSDIFGKVAQAVGGHISASTGRSLGSLLKGAARQILPIAAASVGESGDMEAPDQELEAEMEERDWEAANTFVKLAEEAAQIAAQSPPQADPATTATDAVTQAAQTHAPALVAGPPSPRMPLAPFPQAPRGLGRRRSGRWIRRGNHIVLLGV